MERSIVIYGLAGGNYRALDCYVINASEANGISYLKLLAYTMRNQNPAVDRVYAIDNRPALKHEYLKSKNVHGNAFEPCVIFKTTLETEGVRLI